MSIEKKVACARLDSELIYILMRIAKKENRTLSNLIKTILKSISKIARAIII